MDRNEHSWAVTKQLVVATREGGVDRKANPFALVPTPPVATREGGVDRNASGAAWPTARRTVATREGGVDRNNIFASQKKGWLRRHPRGWRG